MPDPLHRGVMVQSVQFVAPEQIGGFLTKPWTPQPPPRLGKAKVLHGQQATTLGQCAGRAQARFQAPAFVGNPYQATVPAPPQQPAAPQLRSSLPLFSASPIAWTQPVGNDVTGSTSSQHARWDAAALRKSHGVQLAQAQLRNPNLPAPLGAWQTQPPVQPQGQLIAPPGYNAILTPAQPAPAFQQPAFQQPAYQQQAPVFPAAYPAQPGFQPANPALADPPRHRPAARHRQSHVAPHRRVQASAPSRGGCSGGRSAAASLSLGWCLMQLDRPQEAAQAFDAAMASGTGKTREDAAYGKSLASLRANMVNPAVEAANAVALSPKRRNEIGIAVLAQRAVASYNNGGYGEALATLDQRRGFAPETRDLTIMRAWSHYHLGQLDEARRLFAALDQQTSTKESRQGLGAIDSKTPGRRD